MQQSTEKNTNATPHSAHDSKVVFYDDQCTLCSQLALFAKKLSPSGFVFKRVSDELAELSRLPGDPRRQLTVRINDDWFFGADAWQAISDHHSKLDQLNWLAAKLGLHNAPIKLIEKSGSWLKNRCHSC